jgi:eukaryotic-like serine/threonine-protein kinase
VSAVTQTGATGKPPGEVLTQVPARRTQAALGSGVALEIVKGAPSIVGLTVDQARKVVADFDLTLVEPPPTKESDAPPGQVLKQAGPSGKEVTATVAIPFAIPVPNLTLPVLTVEAAAAKLAALRLGLEQIGTVETDATAGTIADQVPKANTKLPPGSVVGVKVAIPRVPLEITVPGITNRKLEQARATLEAAGLTLIVGGEETSPQPAGNVIRQTPETGRVPRKSSVSVVVALSPDATTTVVPDVRGLTVRTAKQRIEASKLKAANLAPTGIVADQSPLGGVRVPIDSEVRLVSAP